MKPSFSINEYDKDGDITEEGIYFHFGDTKIKVADDVAELDEWPDRIVKIIQEIKESYRREK